MMARLPSFAEFQARLADPACDLTVAEVFIVTASALSGDMLQSYSGMALSIEKDGWGAGRALGIVPRTLCDQLFAEARTNPEAVRARFGFGKPANLSSEQLAELTERMIQDRVSSYKAGPRRSVDAVWADLAREAWGWGFRALDSATYRRVIPTLTPDQQLLLRDESTQLLTGLLGRWRHLGCPTVDLHGHKYAAALMATPVPPDLEVRPAWDAFMLRLPVPLLTIQDDTGARTALSRVLVGYYANEGMGQHVWSYVAASDTTCLWSINRPQVALTEEEPPLSDGRISVAAFRQTMLPEDAKLRQLLGRCVLGTCLAFAAAKSASAAAAAAASCSRRRPTGVVPPFDRFVVGAPIQVDCRPALNEFLLGTKSGVPMVQWLVRGHWRNQVCGPQRSERRPTWISPYWKGPEDAPVLLRSYEVGTPEEASK